MDLSDRGCPSPDALAAVASGTAAPDAHAAVLAHVDGCGACLEALARLAQVAGAEPSVALDFASAAASSAFYGDAPGSTAPIRWRRGQVLGDRYVVLNELGRGGMGRVYLAHDNVLRREVAVKLVTAGQGAKVEARTLAAARHPNVVSVFDVFAHAGHTLIAMEYVRGPTLGAWVGATRRRRRAVVQRLLGLSAGLAATHAAGVVHGDVKPDNARVDETPGGAAKLADFGLAQVEGARRLGATRAYLAPEQRDAGEATVAGD
ncbi:MAG: serine/threonine protein kinase, partial [Myxococcales bacterium]|nr:serine/threonine protein kinase [Myxococcales bacterium]